MSTFLAILTIIVCFLLVVVVLIQNSKGGGIASNFASSSQVVGVKRQAELIEKITWGLAISLFVLCMASAAFSGSTTTKEGKESVVSVSETTPANNGSGGQQPVANPGSNTTKP